MDASDKNPRTDEAVEGVLGVAADAIDELIRRHQTEATVENLEDRLDRREKFFSLVSHDLRSPLSMAKVCADIILRQPESNALSRSLAERIIMAVARADGMIKDLLDANRLQAGLGLALRRQEGDLRQMLCDFAEELSLVHGTRCRFESDAQAIPGQWDKEALRRALENLVGNAAKYGAPESEITVRLAREGSNAILSVHNIGPAIGETEIGSLFQWHGRTESAFGSEQTGWGLGLMLVKGIAEGHGGTVEVESSAKTGTTFILSLPLSAETA